MKKSIVLALFACLLLTFCSCTDKLLGDIPQVDGESGSLSVFEMEETPVAEFKWEYSNEEQTEITITQYVGACETVVIPKQIEGRPVVRIMGVKDDENKVLIKGAFEGSGVKTVVLPQTVRAVWGFANCKELKTILVREQSDLVHIDGFQNCTSLESLDLSSTKLESVSGFENCTALKEIKLPDSVKRIAERAFYNCTALTEIDLPANLERIDREAFGKCTSLKSITVPAKLDLVNGTDAVTFHTLSSLEEIVFEEGRENLSGYAFFEIKTNAKIIIPASVKEFDPSLFFAYSPCTFVFKGDFPNLVGKKDFYGNPIIFYDPASEGWEDCPWKESYTVKTIE